MAPNQYAQGFTLEKAASATGYPEGFTITHPAEDGSVMSIKQNKGTDFLKNIDLLQGILNVGGGVSRGIGDIVSGTLNLPRDVGVLANYLNIPGVKKLSNIPEVKRPDAPFAQQQSLETEIPEAATGALSLLYGGAGNLLEKTGKLGAIPSNYISKLLSPLTGKNAEATATNFVNNMIGDADVGQLHTPINDKIKLEYSNANDTSKENYNLLKNAAIQRGYLDNVFDPSFSGIGINPGKGINTIESSGLLNNINNDNLSPESSSLLENFLQNKSFKNAHDLQSSLFKDANLLKASKDGRDRMASNNLASSRNALLSDIRNTFIDNGDSDLSSLYDRATNNHKNTVIPFYQDPVVAKMLLKGGRYDNPSTIFNTLKQDNPISNFIKDKLSPIENDFVLAKQLEPAMSVDSKGNVSADPEKLLSSLQKIPVKGYGEFLDSRHQEVINKLGSQLKFKKAIGPIGNILDKLSGPALGAAAIYYGGKKLSSALAGEE